MFRGLANYLGLRVSEKRTTLRSVGNSLLIIAGAGFLIVMPTFLVYVDQANQLLTMQGTIDEGFDKAEKLEAEISESINGDNVDEAEERLGVVKIAELQNNTQP